MKENKKELKARLISECHQVYQNFLDAVKPDLPQDKFTRLENLLLSSSYIAGGFFRSRAMSKKPSDIDIGFLSEEIRDEVFSILKLLPNFGLQRKYAKLLTPNTGNFKVSLLKNQSNELGSLYSFNNYWTMDFPELLQGFDFWCNLGAYHPGSGRFYWFYINTGHFNEMGLTVEYIGDNCTTDSDIVHVLSKTFKIAKEGYEPSVGDLHELLSRFHKQTRLRKNPLSITDIAALDRGGSNGPQQEKGVKKQNKNLLQIIKSDLHKIGHNSKEFRQITPRDLDPIENEVHRVTQTVNWALNPLNWAINTARVDRPGLR